MESITLTIQIPNGLQKSPATYFIQVANTFKSSIWIEKDSTRVNAKSLLGVLSLGIHRGDAINITTNGIDELLAITTIQEYFNASSLGETELEEWMEKFKETHII